MMHLAQVNIARMRGPMNNAIMNGLAARIDENVDSGARIYIASVAKTADGVSKAIRTLSDIAKKYSMTVLMSNCVGPCDNFEAGGRSSAWNDRGELLGRLNDTAEGFLILDTKNGELVQKTI
jgi:hypothetical protein